MTSLTILVALLLSVSVHGRTINQDDFMEQGGDDFVYPPSPMTLYAQLNYIAAMATINEINSQNYTFTAAANQFSTLGQDERKHITGFTQQYQSQPQKLSSVVVPPQGLNADQPFEKVGAGADGDTAYQISWRNESIGIRNQGLCGSCWAFAGVGLVEQWEIRQNRTYKYLSVQQVIDCNTEMFKMGCNGGFIQGFIVYASVTGITRQSWYPYKAVDQPCNTLPLGTPLYKVKSFTNIRSLDCQAMITALKKQIVGVGVATDDNFIYYSSGILSKCGTSMNHEVQLIGYVSNATTSYYLVKNQWGTGWGERGYIRISSTEQSGNLCQICKFPVIANV